MRRLLVSTVAAVALLAGAPVPVRAQETAAPAAAAQSEYAGLAGFFEQAFQERIALSPQSMTALGIIQVPARRGRAKSNESGPWVSRA